MKIKNLFFTLWLVMLSLRVIPAAPLGGVTVFGFVSPIDRGDPYSVTREEWGNHSFRVVPNAAYRTSTSGDGDIGISTDRRRVGMIALQLDDNHAYQLQANLTTWNDLGLFNLTAGVNFYNSDGTILANRVVTGNNLGIAFNGVSLFQINAASISISATTATTISSLASVTTTAGTTADINAPNVRINPSGNKYVFNSISAPAVDTDEVLAYNPATGEVRRSSLKTIAGVGATQVNIYNTSGTLTSDRTINGAGRDLSFTGIKVLTLSSQDSVVSTSLDTHFTANQMRISGNAILKLNTEIPGISGQYLRNDGGNDQVHYATVYHEGRGVKSGSIYTFNNATTNTYLIPDYPSIDEIPAGSFAVLSFNSDSTGGEFIKLGSLTTSIPIATHDGAVIMAGTIRSNVPYMLIKGGSGGSGKWYMQGNTGPLVGGGGGGSVNIYNTDGSLTSTRTVDGNGQAFRLQNAASILLSTTGVLDLTGNNGVKITTPSGTQVPGSYLRVQPGVSGYVDYAIISRTGFGVKSGANYTADGINIYPAYTAGVQHPDGTIVYLKFDSVSTAGDTLAVGNSPATKIAHQDGTDVFSGELKAERYYTLILSGTGGTARWVLQGETSSSIGSMTAENSAKVFDNVAALVAFNPTGGNEAFTRGYWTAGDGGGGRYLWVNNQTSTNLGSKVASSVSGSWSLINDVVNVRQWGAKGDDATDDAARINAAIAWSVTPTPTKEVYIPKGTFRISTPLIVDTDNVSIRIHGRVKNINGVNSAVMEIAKVSAPTLTAGIVTYQFGNITINGDNMGILDQNGPNATPWASTNQLTAWHGVYSRGVDGLQFKNMIVTNAIIWGIAFERSRNVNVVGCNVINTAHSGRTYLGVFQKSTQDAIHLHDCRDSSMVNNYAESQDDTFAVSAAVTHAANIVVHGNIGKVATRFKMADGVTADTNTPVGRMFLTAFINNPSAYASLTNVVFSGNVCKGGHGLFLVEDLINVAHAGTVSGIKFIGNTFHGLVDTAITGNVQQGWFINGGKNITIENNTFLNIARVGRILEFGSSRNGTIVFRGNHFSNFQSAPDFTSILGSTPDSIIWATEFENLVIDNNTFTDNGISPIYIGPRGASTNGLYNSVIIRGNSFINNNLSRVPGAESHVVHITGANEVVASDNIMSGSRGDQLYIRSWKSLLVSGNKIKGLKAGDTANADAIVGYNPVNATTETTTIEGNVLEDIDGYSGYLYNPGFISVRNNVVRNSNVGYGFDTAFSIYLSGSSLSELQFVNFGGIFQGNQILDNTAKTPLIINGDISTASYTGRKLAYLDTQDAGGDISVFPNGAGVVEMSQGFVSIAGSSYTLRVAQQFAVTAITCTVNLPDATLCRNKIFAIKNAPTAATLTLDALGSQTIDGSLTLATSTVNEVLKIISNGSNWLRY